MPLQNRVDPFGTIVAYPERGAWMGNRGCLHDAGREIRRAWQVRRWITCVLSFRGRHREVMMPRRYTELFFLDEATSFAAGHRPCGECRYAEYRRFRLLWEGVHPRDPVGADAIDLRLHGERVGLGRSRRVWSGDAASLVDGVVVRVDGRAWLVRGSSLLAWTPSGYGERRARPSRGLVEVLTPASVVDVFRAGYVPQVDASAG
jgi:hypothetical protein